MNSFLNSLQINLVSHIQEWINSKNGAPPPSPLSSDLSTGARGAQAETLAEEDKSGDRPISVIMRKPYDLTHSLTEKVHTSYNISVIVLPPTPLRFQEGVGGFAYEKILVPVQIWQPIFSYDDRLPVPLAEKLCEELNRLELKIENISGCLELDTSNPWRQIQDNLRPYNYIIEIQFTFSGTLPAEVLTSPTILHEN